MKKIFFSTLLIFSYVLNSQCQRHDNIWFVGQDFQGDNWYGVYELNFNFFPVKVTEKPGFMSFRLTSSTYCDSLGNLLFYTNGISLKDSNNETVEGGEELNPGPQQQATVPQGYNFPKGSFFLPAPDNDSLLYLLHTSMDYLPLDIRTVGGSVLYYTLIDKNFNNGKGKVLEANVPLLVEEMRPSTAVRHANGRDWWIMVSHEAENLYYSFLLTPEGFEGPFEQLIGSEKKDTFNNLTALQSFSPDGKRFVDYNGNLGYSLYDFDRCTGVLSNEYRLNFNEADTLGFFFDAGFSLNNRFLYVSTLWGTRRFGGVQDNPLLIQYDLKSDDIALSADTIGLRDTIPNDPIPNSFSINFDGNHLAPDGKLYSFSGVTKMHSIQEPNRKGKESRLMKRFPFVEKAIAITYPYYPNYRLGPLDGSPCDTLNIDNHPRANYRWENWDTLNELHIEFADLSYYEPAEWFWDFEGLGTSRDTNPAFTFPAPGIYEVCLSVSNVNSTHTTCKNVPVGKGVVDIDYVFEENEPTVYPNPTSNAFQVYLPTSGRMDLQLFNGSGQLVLQESDVESGEQVDISALAKGIYFYNLKNKESEVVHAGKIVVVK